jgi:predicted nucleotidyltransferase component of viral defense system
LIHRKTFFTKKSIRERAERYGFSDLLPVELFLWDCEVTAQLQRESDKLILKGGAAVQLHLPIEMQRGSVDVDLVGPLTPQDVQEIVTQVQKRLPTLGFQRYRPKRPRTKVPLITYFVKTPAIVPTETRKNLEIKTEFLLEDLKLPTETITQAETFAVKVKNLKCYSVTALLGDKLLTLAENTIGVQEPADIPKQIYDVALLSEQRILTPRQLSEIINVIKQLTPIEASYRKLKLNPEDALKDTQNTMEKYSLLDTAGADNSIKRNITNFQQFYVNESQRQPWYEWCIRALRIRFLAQLIAAVIENRATTKQTAKDYSSAVQTAQDLQKISGAQVKELRSRIMALADRDIPYFKELRGKPIHRVFWQVANQENLDAIQNMI